jgi:hypothetical protein
LIQPSILFSPCFFLGSIPTKPDFSFFRKFVETFFSAGTLDKIEEELVSLAGVITVKVRRLNFPAGMVKSGEGITSPLCVSAVVLV